MPQPSVLLIRREALLASRRVRRLALGTLLLALPLALPACASGGEGNDKKAATPRERTTVRVENRSFLDMNIYVVRSSQRIRLGSVTGNSTQRFTIPPNLIFGVSTLQFLADPVGASRSPVSNEIRVTEGDEVTLVIPPS